MLIADRKSNLNIDLIARQLGLSRYWYLKVLPINYTLIWAECYIYSWLVPSQRSSALLNVHVFKEDASINKFFCFLVKEKIIFIQIHNKIWLVWHNQAIKGYIYWLPVGLSQVTEITKKKGTICSFWFRFHFSRFPFGSNLCNRIRIL